MAFDVHDLLLPSVGQRVRLSVDYLDRGTGQFELRYDAVGNSQKTAFTVTKTNSNTWKSSSVVVTDWLFGNRGPNGGDLLLVNVDSEDDIFHKLELTKVQSTSEHFSHFSQVGIDIFHIFTSWPRCRSTPLAWAQSAAAQIPRSIRRSLVTTSPRASCWN